MLFKDNNTPNQELRQRNEQLERFFLLNLDLLCIADLEGNFIKVNKEWEKTLGYAVEDIENQKFLNYVHPEDVQPTLDMGARCCFMG